MTITVMSLSILYICLYFYSLNNNCIFLLFLCAKNLISYKLHETSICSQRFTVISHLQLYPKQILQHLFTLFPDSKDQITLGYLTLWTYEEIVERWFAYLHLGTLQRSTLRCKTKYKLVKIHFLAVFGLHPIMHDSSHR